MIPDNMDIDISVEGANWDNGFSTYGDAISTCMTLICSHVPEAANFANFSHLEISILLADDNDIQQLNRDYREKDKATNVLSFPSLPDEEIEEFLGKAENIPDYPIALGDIIFAYETIKQEAEKQGKSFSDHFHHLCLHGMLHLVGYDHIEDDEAQNMEALEKLLLSKLSIDDPYQD